VVILMNMALGKQSQQLVPALILFVEPERDHRGSFIFLAAVREVKQKLLH